MSTTPHNEQRHTPSQRYARIVGSPGVRVRMAGLLRTQWPLLIVVALAGYLLRAALPHPHKHDGRTSFPGARGCRSRGCQP